jgi:argonaute-like protein implicated in RNA metabolism and viral defense
MLILYWVLASAIALFIYASVQWRLRHITAKVRSPLKKQKNRVANVSLLSLEVGDRLLVAMDDEGVLTGEWEEMDVVSVSVLHNYSKDPQKLDPYVCVGVKHSELICFNYTMYCANNRVKMLTHS